MWHLIPVVVVAGVLAACSSEPAPANGAQPACTSGDQKACDCPGGSVTGVQVCKSDGSGWDTCSGCNPCGNCDGCCDGATCTPLSIQSATACGERGTSCSTCEAGYACSQGRCVVDQGQCSSATCAGCCSTNYCFGTDEQFWAACGAGGGQCDSCTMGALCSAGTCTNNVDPDLFFSIRVLSVEVADHDSSGDTWDTAGGLPDPYVCLGITGNAACTTTCDDTVGCSYSGSSGVIGGASALLFKGSDLKNLWIGVYDEDVSYNDEMGSGTMNVSEINSSYQTGPFGGVVNVQYAIY